MSGAVRRRDQRWKFILPGVFVAIALFTFLSQSFKSLDEEADAASLANFDPGYIISDYQMGNYNSMNEAEIQAFLKSKNSCNDTNLSRYTYGNKVDYYSETTPYTWHVDSGHFVCMADEVINGETAAHIIWQAAQDFRINPQVLIVVLQKEQGIVTDTFPHSIQYRSAMGYGCPDTAPCSPSYAGFRNQVRNAAGMFRTVLDGGWTNYPVGDNYIQYNPNASCGGSVVNIKNRATSALYRYTPYQPNAGALAVGYGTAYCGAYGNRNFYLYFEDWFGGVTSEGYTALEVPRFMLAKKDTNYVNSSTGERTEKKITVNEPVMFTTKILLNGEWCLRSKEDTFSNTSVCVPFSELSNLEYIYLPENEQYMAIKEGASKRSPIDKTRKFNTFNNDSFRRFIKYFIFDGVKYYVTESDNAESSFPIYGFLEEDLIRLQEYSRVFMYLQTSCDINYKVNFVNGKKIRLTVLGQISRLFTAKVKYNDEWYFITMNDERNDLLPLGIYGECLSAATEYTDFETPREMRVKNDTYSADPATGTIYGPVRKGQVIYFDQKVEINGRWFFRSRYNSERDLDIAIPAVDIENI